MTEPNSTRLSRVFRQLSREDYPKGDLAALRRMDVRDPPGFSFYRLLQSAEVEYPTSDEQEKRWALALRTMAVLKDLHDPDVQIGTALWELWGANSRDVRFVRLMRAEETLATEIRSVTATLRSKGVRVNTIQLANFILTQDSEKADDFRLQIARDFYKKEKPQPEN